MVLEGLIEEASVVRLLAGEVLATSELCTADVHSLGLERCAEGILLPAALERLDQPRVLSMLTTTATKVWPRLAVVPMIESTNSSLLAAGDAAAGAVLTAEYQYGGRGRRGRTWVSPIGRNIAVSLGWRTVLDINELGGLSLVVGLALADVLQSQGVRKVRLKWPNDVLIDMAKLAGVLIEVQPLAEGCLVVIGIGVNHNSAMLTRGSIEQDVADVAEVAPTIGRNRLLAMLINGLADYVTQFERDGFGGMVDAWESLHAYQGCDLVLESGANSIVGTVSYTHLTLPTNREV